MNNQYLLDLINEVKNRGGGMMLNSDNVPAVVVLTIEKYNELVTSDKLQMTSGNPELVKKGKVLVTGGAGYIGGHLVYELVSAGYEVLVLDNLSTGKKENLHSSAIFIEGDLADENLLKDIFAAHKIDAVFHMAASLEVEESVKNPDKYLHNNVFNTIKLLSVMEEAGVKKIIFSSTAAVLWGIATEFNYGKRRAQAKQPIRLQQIISRKNN